MNRLRLLFPLAALGFLLPPAPAIALEAAIASANPLATRAGVEILNQGGNAFDAAVAVSAALAVVEPYSSGLGGGGFWLLHRASDGFETMVDGREAAPARASARMYLDEDGEPVASASREGPKAAGIPGEPAALAHLAKKYGKLTLARDLAPAIRLARAGFVVDARYLDMAARSRDLLRSFPRAAQIFLGGNEPPKPGFTLRQPELAATLEAIAKSGAAEFYRGRMAKNIAAAVARAGGIWRARDLNAYRVIERPPVKFYYRGLTVTSAALPSSGGMVLAEALHILENFSLDSARGPEAAHLVIEAMRRAYQDRARYLGDPDFISVPVKRLASPGYAVQRAKTITAERATPSAELGAAAGPMEGGNTTHFSIVDSQGNRVSATLSINTPFGSGFVAGGSGVILNNEMDDFSTAPGVPNAFGLVGGRANAIAPGKRPLSSMSPTFVEDRRGILIVGTPGGARIISMVLLAILDNAAQEKPRLEDILAAPRYHHQYLPDQVEIEPQGFSADWVAALEARGHKIVVAPRKWGNMQAVYINKQNGEVTAANDPRGE